jgi:hypothetical protein
MKRRAIENGSWMKLRRSGDGSERNRGRLGAGRRGRPRTEAGPIRGSAAEVGGAEARHGPDGEAGWTGPPGGRSRGPAEQAGEAPPRRSRVGRADRSRQEGPGRSPNPAVHAPRITRELQAGPPPKNRSAGVNRTLSSTENREIAGRITAPGVGVKDGSTRHDAARAPGGGREPSCRGNCLDMAEGFRDIRRTPGACLPGMSPLPHAPARCPPWLDTTGKVAAWTSEGTSTGSATPPTGCAT